LLIDVFRGLKLLYLLSMMKFGLEIQRFFCHTICLFSAKIVKMQENAIKN